MFFDDTIAAISSAVGPAARIIARISGPESTTLAGSLGIPDAGPGAHHTTLVFAGLSVPAWVYQFVAPRSYTGQDLLEFHLPGNPLLARMLLDWLLAHGARLAQPGEFTARAYFNGKLDLAQAEGVAATIAAQSGQHLAAARQLMAGELSRRLRPIMDLLADVLALVEAGIDFSNEGIEIFPAPEARQRIAAIGEQLQSLATESVRFEKLTHEPAIVLAGRPNAGKSTLLNALAGHRRGIISPVAGTTRDVLSTEVVLRRGIARLIDIAGLEDQPPGEEIPRQMQQQARRAIAEADVLVLVREATDAQPMVPWVRDTIGGSLFAPSPCTQGEGRGGGELEWQSPGHTQDDPHPNPPPEYRERGKEKNDAPPVLSRALFLLPRQPQLMVISKIDLCPDIVMPDGGIAVSAVTGTGMEELRKALDDLAFGSDTPVAVLALTARHLQAIDEAAAALRRGQNEIGAAPEILAAELRCALDALGQILGIVTPDDILGKIFSSFCIGK